MLKGKNIPTQLEKIAIIDGLQADLAALPTEYPCEGSVKRILCHSSRHDSVWIEEARIYHDFRIGAIILFAY
jgi:hypothetical protein